MFLMTSPTLILLASTLSSSIILMLSSPNILICWLALELNSMAFIPLISNASPKSGEASLKYFLAQTLGSMLVLLSICMNLNLFSLSNILLLLGLMLKLGSAPFHNWLPSMSGSLSWSTFFVLLTIQKINPLIMVIYSLNYSMLIFLFSIISLIVGALVGLIQTQTRKLLVYSSINQLGWLISASWVSNKLVAIFFLSYCILLFPITSLCQKTNFNFLNQMIMKPYNLSLTVFLNMTFLSLGGLPPFLGFLPKWFLLQSAIEQGLLLLTFIMIMTSLLTLFFYLRLTFNAFLLKNNHWKMSTSWSLSNLMIFMTQISLLSLGLISVI